MPCFKYGYLGTTSHWIKIISSWPYALRKFSLKTHPFNDSNNYWPLLLLSRSNLFEWSTMLSKKTTDTKKWMQNTMLSCIPRRRKNAVEFERPMLLSCCSTVGATLFGAKRVTLAPKTLQWFRATFRQQYYSLFFLIISFSRTLSPSQRFNSTFRFFSTNSSTATTMEQYNLKLIEKKTNSPTNEEFCQIKNLFNRPTPLFVTNQPKEKILKIIVEGNIGSGKTTFLSIFSKICKTKSINNPLIIPEPVDLWRNVNGVNIFQLLADDTKRWSFTFQSYVQLTMFQIHQIMPEKSNLKVMERSLYSARYCFVEVLRQKGFIGDCEYHILDQWFNSCIHSGISIDLIIYLRTDPDVVFKRIHTRGRPEESKITLDYLRSLHELHEDWLVHQKFPLPAPVITIDANIPLEEIMSIYEEKTGGILRQHQAIST